MYKTVGNNSKIKPIMLFKTKFKLIFLKKIKLILKIRETSFNYQSHFWIVRTFLGRREEC